MGRRGRKNCRVIGIVREVSRRLATKVLNSGPGCWIRQSAKMPKRARTRYCASQKDH